MPTTDAPLLTARAIAQRLGISTRTLWRWIEAGRFPQPARLSRKTLRWSAEAVEDWLDRQGNGEAA